MTFFSRQQQAKQKKGSSRETKQKTIDGNIVVKDKSFLFGTQEIQQQTPTQQNNAPLVSQPQQQGLVNEPSSIPKPGVISLAPVQGIPKPSDLLAKTPLKNAGFNTNAIVDPQAQASVLGSNNMSVVQQPQTKPVFTTAPPHSFPVGSQPTANAVISTQQCINAPQSVQPVQPVHPVQVQPSYVKTNLVEPSPVVPVQTSSSARQIASTTSTTPVQSNTVFDEESESDEGSEEHYAGYDTDEDTENSEEE